MNLLSMRDTVAKWRDDCAAKLRRLEAKRDADTEGRDRLLRNIEGYDRTLELLDQAGMG